LDRSRFATQDDTDSEGFQRAARLTAGFAGGAGQEPGIAGPALWQAIDAVNRDPAWDRGPSDRNGPIWEEIAVSGNTGWTAAQAGAKPLGSPGTGHAAYLTDAAGSGIATVEACAAIEGVSYTDTIEIEFGPGPLSVFVDKPVASKNRARLLGTHSEAGGGDFKTLNGSDPADFPAAAGFAGGRSM
jgi:hypothetical protein